MNNGRTIIAVATQEELSLLDDDYMGMPVVIMGIGATNVMSALDGLSRDYEVINVGYAGSPNLPKGSIVEISRSSLFHRNCDYREPVYELQRQGVPCFSSCDFVTETDKKDCVFDMELAFICAMGFRSVKAIKVVSDNLDYGEYENTITK